MNKERRLPFTRRMDEVKKLFTEDEKELSGLSLQTNTLLENFSSEKIRRKREQEAKAELERNKEIAKIDFRSHISDQINLRYIDMVHDYKVRIKSKYDGLKGQELEDYKRVLLGLKVKFKIS